MVAYLKCMELKDAMQMLLSKVRGLELFYQTAHWSCHGPDSYSDHLLYERLYNDVVEELDMVGERAIGLTLDVSTVAIEDSLHAIMESIAVESVDTCDLCTVAIILEEEFLGLIDVFGKSPISAGLTDLVGQLGSKHEEHMYLLQQRCAMEDQLAETIEHVEIAPPHQEVQSPNVIVMAQQEQLELFRWNQYIIYVDLPLMGDGTITGTVNAPTGWVGTWNCYPDGGITYSDHLNVPHQIQEMLDSSCKEFLLAADQKVKKALDEAFIEVRMRIKDGKVPLSDLMQFWHLIKETKKLATANLVDHRILAFVDKFNKALQNMAFKDQEIAAQDLQRQGIDPKSLEKIFVKFFEAIKPYEKLVF